MIVIFFNNVINVSGTQYFIYYDTCPGADIYFIQCCMLYVISENIKFVSNLTDSNLKRGTFDKTFDRKEMFSFL